MSRTYQMPFIFNAVVDPNEIGAIVDNYWWCTFRSRNGGVLARTPWWSCGRSQAAFLDIIAAREQARNATCNVDAEANSK